MVAAPAPPTEVELPRSATTIDSLPVEILTEVLLRVPTTDALVHAAATSRSWRGAIANPDFLARYRELHKSSPFLGLYVPRQLAGPPSFHIPDSIHCAGDDTGSRHLKDAALKAVNIGGVRRYQDHRLHDAVDILGGPQVHPDCRLLDCHNSRLLLTRGDEALEVLSPLARHSILLPFPPDVLQPDYLEACLLQGHDGSAAAAFRVVYLQHRREGRNRRQVRAVEYDSTRKSWQEHPWQTINGIQGPPGEVMHAGHRMFCRYRDRSQAVLMLDTRKMEFSVLPLPTDVNFAIGEIEDNVCCLVESIDSKRYRVWKLEEERMDWKLEKDISLDQVLANHVQYLVGYYIPRAISNGIALVCSTTLSHHFVLDLNTGTLMDMFEFQGRSAYIMQMPWPPAFSHPTAAREFDRYGEPATVGNTRTVAGESDKIEGLLGGALALVEEPMHVDPCQTWPEPSPSPSVGRSFSTDPSQEATMARLLYSSSIACSVPGTSCRNQDIDPTTAPPTDLLTISSPAKYVEDRQLMALTTVGSPSCPQQGQVSAEFAVPKPDTNMAEASERAEKMHKDGLNLNQESGAAGQKQDKESTSTRRVDDAKERRRERARARWHARSQEKRERERERDRARWHAMSQDKKEHKRKMARARWHARREAYMIKQRQQPSIKNINDGDDKSNKEMSIIEDTSPYTVGSLVPAMNLGSSNENQPKLRDGAALHYLLSNEPQDLDIQDPTATAPTVPSVEPEEPLLRERSLNHDLMLQPPTLTSCLQQGGRVDGSRGGKGSHEPVEPLLRVQSLNHDLVLQPPTLTSCPQQGGKLDGSRGGKGSHEVTMGQGRRQKKPNPKYL